MKIVFFLRQFIQQKNIRFLGIVIILLTIPVTLFILSTSQDNRQRASEPSSLSSDTPVCSCESLNATEISTDSTTTFSYRTKINDGLPETDEISVRFHELRERNNTIEELQVSPEIISSPFPGDQTGIIFESQWKYTTPKRDTLQKGDIYTIRADATCTRKQSKAKNDSSKLVVGSTVTSKKVLAAKNSVQIGTFIPGIKASITQLNICNMMQFIFK